MATNDWIWIKGVENDDVYNGAFQITYVNANSYTYTTNDTITSSPATGGSITATFSITTC